MSKEMDKALVQIIEGITQLICQTSANCTKEVLKIAESYLEKNTHQTLEDFYALYFSQKTEDDKNQINNEVDDLMNQAQASMAKGETVELQVDPEKEKNRLALSAVQKELEGLITLEKDLRNKLAPVLSSMQFEDALRQRMEHIEFGWKHLSEKNFDESSYDLELLKSQMSSTEETASFYKIALNEEPPPEDEGAQKSSVLLF